MLSRIKAWVLPVFAAVALSTVIFVTVMSIQSSADRQRNDRVVCAAVNRINAAAVGLLDDLLAGPRVSAKERTAVLDKTRARFPSLDCTKDAISFRP